MKTRLFWLALSIALAATGCGSKGSKLPEGAAATVDGQTITIPEVEKVAQNFLRQNVPPDSTVEGATRPEQIYNTALARLVEGKDPVVAYLKTETVRTNLDIQIKCKASGEIIKLPFDVSDSVNKGDLLRTYLVEPFAGVRHSLRFVQGPAGSVTDRAVEGFVQVDLSVGHLLSGFAVIAQMEIPHRCFP